MTESDKQRQDKLSSQGYTGRAKFVGYSVDYLDGFTYGKIYTFKDGICINDCGDPINDEALKDFVKVVE